LNCFILLNNIQLNVHCFSAFLLPKCQRTLVLFKYTVTEICLRNTSIKWDGKNITFIIQKRGQTNFMQILLQNACL